MTVMSEVERNTTMTAARSKLTTAVRVLSICLVVLSVANAAGDDKPREVPLSSIYTLARIGIDRTRITKPGTVLVIQKDGILANPSVDFGTVTDKVVNGKILEPSGFQAAFFAKPNNKSLKAGETVYPTRISVKGDQIRFEIITCNTSDVSVKGNTLQQRYAATIAFEFPNGFLATADAAIVKKAIDEVLLPQEEAQAVKTKTIELGQTPEQVESALGKPSKIVNLGHKVTWIYSDMKVIFVEGKVSDVQ